MSGKLFFVSGLTGAGKTTLIGAALESVDNLEVLTTYTTRPRRPSEAHAYEYIFVDDEEYDRIKAQSSNWDETIYNGYKYSSDAGKFIDDLQKGINVIVSVTPDMEDIRAMSKIYGVKPVTIWINTPKDIASARVRDDKRRSMRVEDESVKEFFDIVFEPTGDLEKDKRLFSELIEGESIQLRSSTAPLH